MSTTTKNKTKVVEHSRSSWGWILVLVLVFTTNGLMAQAGGSSTNAFNFNIGMNLPEEPQRIDVAIRILFLITLLAVAPSLVMLMTSFTRIIIVFSFLRNALGLQGVPANQIMVGFALFLTFFIMQPVYQRIDADAIKPYSAGSITGAKALDVTKGHAKDFMLRQARPKDVEFFVGLAKMGPTKVEDLPLSVVIPGFVLSELRTGFQMGFLLFIPFILIDFVVAIVLMSLGLLFLPPVTISMPLKILLFVLVDGWTLIVRSLALSFGM
ncbi:MAG: flagellar type III secretion system pore protein FliP [Verrucomicrobiota bacterium]|nr:flagellar type III secretion system pore protein FliP [Verrucomicrobiota bacterium]